MKTKIWSFTTRISHWLLALGFTVAYITGEKEWQMNYHYAFGALVGGITFFRLLYGIVGPKYSNLKDFPMGISHQIDFIKNYFFKNSYVGHNPLASVVMLTMMLAGVFTAITGYFWATETAQFLGFTLTEEGVEESHEFGAKLFLILVFAHLAGIFADTIFHRKTGTLASIFTGYKNVQAESGNTNAFHKVFSLLWLGGSFFLAYLAFGLPANERGNEREHEEEDEWESLLYPDGNSEKKPINITLRRSKSANVDGTSGASNNRQQDIATYKNTDSYTYKNTIETPPYYANNSSYENEYDEHYKHEHKRKHHHHDNDHEREHDDD
jgi:cytochrome b